MCLWYNYQTRDKWLTRKTLSNKKFILIKSLKKKGLDITFFILYIYI